MNVEDVDSEVEEQPFRPTPNIPLVEGKTDEEARELVQNSCLAGITPGMAGVSARNWQELATLAVGSLDIRMLGDVHPWVTSFSDFRGPPTNLKRADHRKYFGEKVLKYGGIDFVLRTLHDFPVNEPMGKGVAELFWCGGAAVNLAKMAYFLRHPSVYRTLLLPRLTRETKVGQLGSITAQAFANSVLAKLISFYDGRESCFAQIRDCRRLLGGEMTCVMSDGARGLAIMSGIADAWSELDWKNGRTQLCILYSIMDAGGVFQPWARQGIAYAERYRDLLLEYRNTSLPFTPHAFACLCMEKVVFDQPGLEILCNEFGLATEVKSRGLPPVSLRELHTLRVALGIRANAMPDQRPLSIVVGRLHDLIE